jgi:hypothetical protein
MWTRVFKIHDLPAEATDPSWDNTRATAMPPTDIPAFRPLSSRPSDCGIVETSLGASAQFTIPPGKEVVPLGGLLFVTGWLIFWTLALLYYLFTPAKHGAVFTALALLFSLLFEYFALMVFISAAVARFAVETITLGPDGVSRELRFGPLRRSRRVALAGARTFRVDTYPGSRSGRGPRRWTAHLVLTRCSGAPLRLAEGARDTDKPWLADRLNELLLTRRAAP